MSATRTEPNVVAYTCHRVTCGTRGYLGRAGFRQPVDVPKEQITYNGTLEGLTTSDKVYFLQRFGLELTNTSAVYRNDQGQYVFPVRGPSGNTRGHVVRRAAWSGEKGGPRCPLPIYATPKSKSYRLNPHGAFSAWYRPALLGPTAPVVVVEDQVSALCAAGAGFRSMALLGVHMSNEIARELQVEGRPVILALDADATETSLNIAQKWGPALPQCRVLILTSDVKDDITQLEALL